MARNGFESWAEAWTREQEIWQDTLGVSGFEEMIYRYSPVADFFARASKRNANELLASGVVALGDYAVISRSPFFWTTTPKNICVIEGRGCVRRSYEDHEGLVTLGDELSWTELYQPSQLAEGPVPYIPNIPKQRRKRRENQLETFYLPGDHIVGVVRLANVKLSMVSDAILTCRDGDSLLREIQSWISEIVVREIFGNEANIREKLLSMVIWSEALKYFDRLRAFFSGFPDIDIYQSCVGRWLDAEERAAAIASRTSRTYTRDRALNYYFNFFDSFKGIDPCIAIFLRDSIRLLKRIDDSKRSNKGGHSAQWKQ